MLEIKGVSKRFGGLVALNQVSFEVRRGEIVGLIGPNGAGKTTLLHVVSGLLFEDQGEVRLRGRSLKGLAPWERAARGLARTFQHIRIFPGLSVLENVLCGFHLRRRAGFLSALFHLPRTAREEGYLREQALRLLASLGLAEKALLPAETLPYGEQKKVVLARALASNPQVLLLDEPAAGLNERETRELGTYLRALQSQEMAILLVEHDLNLVVEVCQRVVALDQGRIIAQGAPEEVQNHPAVLEAYLGR
ncbi:MAG: hypothetical protein DSZ24_06195 [Thermodesulfatator sp.]|nr:MAG: hypothetical protein DSZ24_06195 [Thermodesulfatator sp.]